MKKLYSFCSRTNEKKNNDKIKILFKKNDEEVYQKQYMKKVTMEFDVGLWNNFHKKEEENKINTFKYQNDEELIDIHFCIDKSLYYFFVDEVINDDNNNIEKIYFIY